MRCRDDAACRRRARPALGIVDGGVELSPRYDERYAPPVGSRYWFPTRETMPPVEREAAILARLKEVTHYAWEHAPFYRRKWDEAGFHPDQLRSLEDFE